MELRAEQAGARRHGQRSQSPRRPAACHGGDDGGHGFGRWPLAAEHARADAVSKTREVGVVETARGESESCSSVLRCTAFAASSVSTSRQPMPGSAVCSTRSASTSMSTAKLPVSRWQDDQGIWRGRRDDRDRARRQSQRVVVVLDHGVLWSQQPGGEKVNEVRAVGDDQVRFLLGRPVPWGGARGGGVEEPRLASQTITSISSSGKRSMICGLPSPE